VGRNIPNSAPPKTQASTIELMAMELTVRLSSEISHAPFAHGITRFYLKSLQIARTHLSPAGNSYDRWPGCDRSPLSGLRYGDESMS
jgi:hypothetical protein